MVDLAFGEIRRGYVEVGDIITPQPWLENGPVPVHPTSPGPRPRREGQDVAQQSGDLAGT